jgi:tagatose 1,6-diphosphate aldolase
MKLYNYDLIQGQEIDIKLLRKSSGDKEKGRSPEYKFQIQLHGQEQSIGHINLRLGQNEKVVKYIGHIGYGVDKAYRGNKYSVKACLLIKEVLKDHGIEEVIITCNPDNYPSRNTCEAIGAQLIEIVDVPKSLDIYSEEEARKCRYEWRIQ